MLLQIAGVSKNLKKYHNWRFGVLIEELSSKSYLGAVLAMILPMFTMDYSSMFDQAGPVCKSLRAKVTTIFVSSIVVLDH